MPHWKKKKKKKKLKKRDPIFSIMEKSLIQMEQNEKNKFSIIESWKNLFAKKKERNK